MKLTLLAFFSFLFTSCNYQYFTLSGDLVSKDKNNDFVIENDTLKVTYRFSGDHGPVSITIYNKTDEPLEINWKKSALIVNDKASSYYSPNLFLSGNIRHDSAKYFYNNFTSSANSDVKADIYVNEPSQFIPPKSSVSKVPLTLPSKFIWLQANRLTKETLITSKYYNVTYRKMAYKSEKSPLAFRSYLNFNYGGDQKREFSIDLHFYVSEIWQSGSSPFSFPQEIIERGDFFHVRS